MIYHFQLVNILIHMMVNIKNWSDELHVYLIKMPCSSYVCVEVDPEKMTKNKTQIFLLR